MGGRALEGLRRLKDGPTRGRAAAAEVMPWFKAADVTPAEGERVLVHDAAAGRVEAGRYVGGRWHVEDLRDGSLTEKAGVTHWAPLLDSEEYDPADD